VGGRAESVVARRFGTRGLRSATRLFLALSTMSAIENQARFYWKDTFRFVVTGASKSRRKGQ
jgi:hypothetical protein